MCDLEEFELAEYLAWLEAARPAARRTKQEPKGSVLTAVPLLAEAAVEA